MNQRRALGSALGIQLTAVLAAGGLVALTPLPWASGLILVLFLGSLGLLTSIFLFRAPVAPDKREGRWAIAIAVALLSISALALAGIAGYEIRGRPSQYRFLVTTSDAYIPIKSVPHKQAATSRLVSAGDRVIVDCFADEQDWRWFRLSNGTGWLRADEVMAEPHTGQASPPRCPD